MLFHCVRVRHYCCYYYYYYYYYLCTFYYLMWLDGVRILLLSPDDSNISDIHQKRLQKANKIRNDEHEFHP